MTSNEQIRRLRQLYQDGVITEETYQDAIAKVPEEKKLDILVNHHGMLVIVLVYRQSKWTIRIPLAYSWIDYVRERFPITTSVQGRKNKGLWKVLNENKVKLHRLDVERKQTFLYQHDKSGVKSEPMGKGRVLTVEEKEIY